VLPTLCRTFRSLQKKNYFAEEKIFGHFLREFWLKENSIFVHGEWENDNISWTSLELERKRGGKQFSPFRPFLLKIKKNSAADLSIRSTFYLALFDLYGQIIGQLATQRTF
jgi:hypothetical protein